LGPRMPRPGGTGVSVTRRSPKPQRQVRFLGPPLARQHRIPGIHGESHGRGVRWPGRRDASLVSPHPPTWTSAGPLPGGPSLPWQGPGRLGTAVCRSAHRRIRERSGPAQQPDITHVEDPLNRSERAGHRSRRSGRRSRRRCRSDRCLPGGRCHPRGRRSSVVRSERIATQDAARRALPSRPRRPAWGTAARRRTRDGAGPWVRQSSPRPARRRGPSASGSTPRRTRAGSGRAR
jgi:hypothetical protein